MTSWIQKTLHPLRWMKLKRRVPHDWRRGCFSIEHPLLSGAERAHIGFLSLLACVAYIEARQKINPANMTVYVYDENGCRVGRLKKHCIRHLPGHLAVAGARDLETLLATGNSLRQETEIIFTERD